MSLDFLNIVGEFVSTWGRVRFRYPHVATEVLCSEIWSIVETCVNHPNQLLVPFWETVLDRSPEEMKTQMVLATHFTKINSVFLGKKPVEVSIASLLHVVLIPLTVVAEFTLFRC